MNAVKRAQHVRMYLFITSICVSSNRSHGCGLASAVVSQEGDDLVLMQVEAQLVEGQLTAGLVHLGQFVDTNHQRQVARLLLNAAHLLWGDKWCTKTGSS